ncbi:MAG: hypothetical protein AVDCRST_MAG64-1361, partial [uncultured Phycisphaerae bacterium]
LDGERLTLENAAPFHAAGEDGSLPRAFDLSPGFHTLVVLPYAATNAGGTASGNDDSSDPDISSNGRFVVFASSATNLTANDTNALVDVYYRDLQTGVTQLVSVSTAGTGPGNGTSSDPSVSDDGRLVTFTSGASNLVASDNNARSDVFVRDMFTGETRLVSVNLTNTGPGNNGGQSAQISDNGRFVVFASESSNLTANDTNIIRDVFVRDLLNNTTTLVSVTPGTTGTSGNGASDAPSISAVGQYIVFVSEATNLDGGAGGPGADVYIRDTILRDTDLVSDSAGNSGGGLVDVNAASPTVSDNGRFVAFVSAATNLTSAADTNGVNDVFRKDTATGDVSRASVGTTGTIANGPSTRAKISADGRYVAFSSTASNLSSLDNGANEDVFIRDFSAGVTSLASVNRNNNGGTGSSQPALTDDGSIVAFSSTARDLVQEVTEDRNVFIATTVAAVDRDVPTFRIPPQPVENVAGSDVIRFVVIYEDNVFLDTGTIDNLDLVVTGPNGFSRTATLFSLVSTTGTSATATYTVAAPSGLLTTEANGTYNVRVAASQVADRARNFLPGIVTTGSFVLALPASETEPPVAVFSGGSPNPGTTTYEFSVIYSDLGGLNLATLDANDVTVTGPNGYSQTATLLGTSELSPTSDAGIYQVTAPGGVWDGPDSGTYTVTMLPGAVADVAGNLVVPGQLGQFVALGPDLVAIPVRGLRSGAISGVDRQRARVRILNQGSSTAAGAVSVRLFTSLDETLDAGDVTIGTFTQDVVIEPDTFEQVNVRFTYPQVREGNYFVLAQVDAGNAILEQDESNNVRASLTRVGLSAPFVDLQPTLVPFTGIRSRTGVNTATLTIRNAGNITAAADITVALAGLGDETPAVGDRPIATVPLKVNLRPGQRKTFRLNFSFPVEFSRGTYRLVATIDAGNLIAERDEDNNRVVSFSSFDYA